MNIGRINSAQPNFKAAYLLSGRKIDVKEAKRMVQMHGGKSVCVKELTDKEPNSYKSPYCCLVVTGKDVEAYNKIAKSVEEEYDATSRMFPDDLRPRDFDSEDEYYDHELLNEISEKISIINKKAGFSSPIRNIGATRAMDAIEKGLFNFKKGIIKKAEPTFSDWEF